MSRKPRASLGSSALGTEPGRLISCRPGPPSLSQRSPKLTRLTVGLANNNRRVPTCKNPA